MKGPSECQEPCAAPLVHKHCRVHMLSEKKAGGDVNFSLLLVRMKEAKNPALDPGLCAQVR